MIQLMVYFSFVHAYSIFITFPSTQTTLMSFFGKLIEGEIVPEQAPPVPSPLCSGYTRPDKDAAVKAHRTRFCSQLSNCNSGIYQCTCAVIIIFHHTTSHVNIHSHSVSFSHHHLLYFMQSIEVLLDHVLQTVFKHEHYSVMFCMSCTIAKNFTVE